MLSSVPDEEACTCAIPAAKQIAAIREERWMSFSTTFPRKAADMPRKKMAKLKAPLGSTFGKADVISDFLAENRPAVYGTDTAVE